MKFMLSLICVPTHDYKCIFLHVNINRFYFKDNSSGLSNCHGQNVPGSSILQLKTGSQLFTACKEFTVMAHVTLFILKRRGDTNVIMYFANCVGTIQKGV